MQLETRATQRADGKGWVDHLGFVGPFRPGVGPRSDPSGDFPTGPDVGTRLPDVVGTDQWGRTIDLHAHRNDGPLILVFHRSAVW